MTAGDGRFEDVVRTLDRRAKNITRRLGNAKPNGVYHER